MTKIKWVKFYTTGTDVKVTYHVESKTVQDNGETHGFVNGEDAMNKSTSEVFTFWDGVPVGTGRVPA